MSAPSTSPVMLITGTSKGMGRAVAEHFVAKGYSVAGCSRGKATLETKGYYHSEVDVSDESQVRSWVRKVGKDFGRIDILICNAGSVQSALLMTVTPSNILQTFLNTHIAGTYYVCREVSKIMIRHKYGRIITVSSLGVPLHLEGTSAYSATKSAVIEMTKILAKELAPAGITCNVFSPALYITDAAEAMGKEWARRLLDKQTIKRTVTIEEICNVISFYLSPESAPITGQVINMGLVV